MFKDRNTRGVNLLPGVISSGSFLRSEPEAPVVVRPLVVHHGEALPRHRWGRGHVPEYADDGGRRHKDEQQSGVEVWHGSDPDLRQGPVSSFGPHFCRSIAGYR